MGVKLSELPADGALSGAEKLAALDGSTNKTLTVDQIATFILAQVGGGGGGAWGEITGDIADQTDLTAAITAAVAAVIDGAPGALNTLNELAAAMADDAAFSTTVLAAIAAKQATLVSGTNIKTVNGSTLLGSGDLTIAAGISGTADNSLVVSGSNLNTNKTPQTLSISTGTATWNMANGFNAVLTLTGNTTLAFSNIQAGSSGLLKVIQDATGSRTFNVPTAGPIDINTAADSETILTFYYDGTDYEWTNSAVSGSGITELTGDVTASGTGSVAATIANDAVTTAKINNGAVTLAKLGATGTPDNTKFLRGDDTWAVPAGGGGGSLTERRIPFGDASNVATESANLQWYNTSGIIQMNSASGSGIIFQNAGAGIFNIEVNGSEYKLYSATATTPRYVWQVDWQGRVTINPDPSIGAVDALTLLRGVARFANLKVGNSGLASSAIIFSNTTDEGTIIEANGAELMIWIGSVKKATFHGNGLSIGNTRTTRALDVTGVTRIDNLELDAIPTYADQSAAVTGGLAVGKVYQTATGELRIVHP